MKVRCWDLCMHNCLPLTVRVCGIAIQCGCFYHSLSCHMMGCFFTVTSHDGLFFIVTSCDGLFSETAVGWLSTSFSLHSTHTTCASNPPYTSYQQEQPSLDAERADCGQCGQWTPCLQPKTQWALGARKQASGHNTWHFSWPLDSGVSGHCVQQEVAMDPKWRGYRWP